MRKSIQRIQARREVRRREAESSISAYRVALETLRAVGGRMRIAQVGANDGCTNDPLYEFLGGEAGVSDLLQVEPQEFLLPMLRENYAFHDRVKIFQGVIGPPGRLALYAVDPRYWPRLKPMRYARGWPLHRAPSGMTSVNREHVSRFLSKVLPGSVDIDDAILTLDAESLPLPAAMERTGFGQDLDVLQVDAEGFDDQVIYHSGIAELKPRIIHFEHKHLPEARFRSLLGFLQAQDYLTHVERSNVTCILGREPARG